MAVQQVAWKPAAACSDRRGAGGGLGTGGNNRGITGKVNPFRTVGSGTALARQGKL